MKWFNKIFDRFVLQMRIDYINRAIHSLTIITEDNGDAQLHINNAKNELNRALQILNGMKERNFNGTK